MIKGRSRGMILLSWIHDLLIFEGIYMLVAGVLNIKERETILFLLQGFVMLIPVILTYVVIRRCKSLWLFTLFSAVLTWVMKMLSGSALTGYLTAFVCLFRCYVRLKEGELRKKMREMPGEAGAEDKTENWEVPAFLDSPRSIHCLVFVLMYLGLLFFHSYTLLLPFVGLLAAEAGVCMAYCYLGAFYEFVEMNRHVANFPINAMRKIRAGILGIGMILLILCMLPAVIYHEEPLSKLNIEPVQSNTVWEMPVYEGEPEPDHMMEELMKIKKEAKETPVWLKLILETAYVVILLFSAVIALRIVILAVKRAMGNFAEEEEDQVFFLGKDETAGEKNLGGIKRLKKESGNSYDRKIRRLYKRIVRRMIGKNITGSETPKELENKAGIHIESVHELYEKARYGKEDCTKEEAKKCAQIFSTLKR